MPMLIKQTFKCNRCGVIIESDDWSPTCKKCGGTMRQVGNPWIK